MNTVTSLLSAAVAAAVLAAAPIHASAKPITAAKASSNRPAALDRLRLVLASDSGDVRIERRRPSSVRMPFFDFRKGS